MGYLMYQSMLDCAWNSARLHRRKRQTVRSFFSSTALIEVAVRAVRDKSNPSSVSNSSGMKSGLVWVFTVVAKDGIST